MKLTNRWNRLIYGLWAPVYDGTVNRLFLPGRRRSIELLALRPGRKVLLPGVGTGADLLMLPEDSYAVGLDLSPAMLAQARRKLPHIKCRVALLQADVQEMLFDESVFDAAVLNLILSVVPDAHTCLRSTLHALKPGGCLVVFDKFQPEGSRPSRFRRVMNIFSTLFGTDITRRFKDIVRDLPCELIVDEPSIAEGMYRVMLLRKS